MPSFPFRCAKCKAVLKISIQQTPDMLVCDRTVHSNLGLPRWNYCQKTSNSSPHMQKQTKGACAGLTALGTTCCVAERDSSTQKKSLTRHRRRWTRVMPLRLHKVGQLRF